MRISDSTREGMVDIAGVTKEQWDILKEEIMFQDQNDCCGLKLVTPDMILTEEYEEGQSDLWANYDSGTEVLTIHRVTLEEYLLGEEGTLFIVCAEAADSPRVEFIKDFIQRLQAAV